MITEFNPVGVESLYLNSAIKIEQPNFEWWMGDNFCWSFIVKRTLLNRLKWFISTKLFLPGTYKWKENEQDET